VQREHELLLHDFTGLAPTGEINQSSHWTTLVLKSFTLLLYTTRMNMYTLMLQLSDWSELYWTGLNWPELGSTELTYEHHPRRTLYILADDVMIQNHLFLDLSGTFHTVIYIANVLEASLFRLGRVTDTHTTPAVIEWSRVPVAL
jgi:hypothetical protein